MTTIHTDGNDVKDIEYRRLCRLIDIARLAGMLRDFPLTNLTEDERAAVLAFERYIVHIENGLFSELGV